MQLIINFDDIDLGDWIVNAGDETSIPVLSDIFKGEIATALVTRLFNSDLKQYVREELYKPVGKELEEYLERGALKEAIAEVVKAKTIYGNNITYWDRFKGEIEKQVSELLATREKGLEAQVIHAVNRNINTVVDTIVKQLYDTHPMKKYLNVAALRNDIVSKLKEANNAISE